MIATAPDAVATPWAQAHALLAGAELYWCSTVRPDGRVEPTVAFAWTTGVASSETRYRW